MKRIVVLGSTGSIGRNVLNVIRHLGPDHYPISALAAHSNIDLLYEQALEFKPNLIAVFDKNKALELQKKLPNMQVVGGLEGLLEVASYSESDLVFNSIVGTSGLQPMMAAIEAGKDVALANKEVLVSAGELIMKASVQHNCQILPVDSEHSAIFQCLQNQPKQSVKRLILTASGGPFLKFSLDQLKNVSLADALNHPTWNMGAKITIDCSTLMNKGFEVIEAHWLFDIPLSQIDVVVHPQSIIHSMVEFIDNTLLAQLGEPEMLTPIQLALTYPEKKAGLLPHFDFTKHSRLDFFKPDFDRFRCLKLAYDSLDLGGSYPCFLNAINETLVERFLKKDISWYDISQKLQHLMNAHKMTKIETLEDVLFIDQQGRREALTI
jgi:1-deoxy-D-xylulose-5-phosphate reductoisomerase